MHCFKTIIPDSRQAKTLILSTNVDQKSLGTVFSIAICRPTGDKWQSKTLFLALFDPRASIVKSIFDCRLSGVMIAKRQIHVPDEMQGLVYLL